MMTAQEAKNLKPGQYVDYLGTKAMVRGVRKNGVIVDYWGSGLQEGKCVVRRVSASHIKPLEESHLQAWTRVINASA